VAQAQTQTIADIARQHRARKGQTKSTWVIHTEDIKGKTPDLPETTAVEAVVAAATPVENVTPSSAPSAVDKWNDENLKLRRKIRDLSDQETAAQLQIDTLSTQIHSPVTSQSAIDQAQAGLNAAQQKLTTVRSDLSSARNELLSMEAQGPPKAPAR